MEQKNAKTTKNEPLIVALFLSVILNVFLFVLCFYEEEQVGYKLLKALGSKPREVHKKYENAPQNLGDLLFELRKKNASDLLLFLKNDFSEETFDGYTSRDVALGLLISDHELNYKKPLTGNLSVKEERIIKIEDSAHNHTEITLLPGLTTEQTVAIKNFVNEEEYPFTTKGLYNGLKKNPMDDGIKRAFFYTEEFTLLENLLSLAPGGVSYDEVLQLIQEGTFEALQYHTGEIKKDQDYKEERRRKLLTSYLDLGSKSAALIFLRSDFKFASTRINDQLTMKLLLFSEESPLIKSYALTLLSSPRKSEVWACAQKVLSTRLNKPEISILPRKEVLNIFGVKSSSFSSEPSKPATKEITSEKVIEIRNVKQISKKIKSTDKKVVPETPKVPKSKCSSYLVQKGDNLWKLARKFNTTVLDIEQANNLTSHDLKPGTTLLIPSKKS